MKMFAFRLRCALLAITSFSIFRVNAIGADFEKIVFQNHSYTICKIDLDNDQVRIFWADENRNIFKSFKSLEKWLELRGSSLVFAMNAGMYHASFEPVGLYVEDGKQLFPLNLNSGEGNFFLHPNGVFAITKQGAKIVESSQFPKLNEQTIVATQSGPLLVLNKQIHPAFNSQSTSRLFRNGVGVVSPRHVVFAISEEPVNFFEFALFFRDKLGCKDALFLDGTISSLHAPALHRSDFKMDLGPIIGVVREKE
jgi:uncharacterized protein YigE (DUF2233 family)